MTSVRFDPAPGALRGTLRPPTDKSISHRAAILSTMAEGRSTIEGYLTSADTRSTLFAMEAIGAEVTVTQGEQGRHRVEIEGVGLRGAGAAEIDVGNAGTLLRILPGWLAGQPKGVWRLDGDASIRTRPVDRIAELLLEMGASVTCRSGRLPPLHLEGSQLHGISYQLPVASAQVKSCLLLAGLIAEGSTEVIEPVATRDHTERMLRARGVEVEESRSRIIVKPPQRIEAADTEVPGDLSSAAFHLAAALLVPGSAVILDGVGLNPTRSGFLAIAERMGARIELDRAPENVGGEPIGRIAARHSELTATTVGAAEVPMAIDELPLVALLGCFADGETLVTGAEELRAKESDRISAVVEGLSGLGADIEELAGGFAVRGSGSLQGGTIDSGGDHRMAMLGAVAGVASKGGVRVSGFDAAGVSYPAFEADLASLCRS
ncbi:MAG: 3-phosphoshikimate 1-carboxyvinyltransferase [Solirubrobacterales bacterium]